VTFALASLLPQEVLQRAQANGRFAGLTAADSYDEFTGKPVRAVAPKSVQWRRQAG
jgi:hypothetical protein